MVKNGMKDNEGVGVLSPPLVRTGVRDKEGVGVLSPPVVRTGLRDREWGRDLISNSGRDECKRQVQR